MDLKTYLMQMPIPDREQFAQRCGTTWGYLRKQLIVNGRFGPEIAIAVERESGGLVRIESLSPDPDWEYVRSSGRHGDAAA